MTGAFTDEVMSGERRVGVVEAEEEEAEEERAEVVAVAENTSGCLLASELYAPPTAVWVVVDKTLQNGRVAREREREGVRSKKEKKKRAQK